MVLDVVVLAAGKGTRMYSDKPKVLHAIGGRPMLAHVVDTAGALPGARLHIVVGAGAGAVKACFSNHSGINWVSQEQQLGTGHAVAQALPAIAGEDGTVLVLYGDVPLIRPQSLEALLAAGGADTVALLTLVTDTPHGLGRILRNDRGQVTAIVEEKDASEEQKQIREINSGIIALPSSRLHDWLSRIGNDNRQGEYYLTDVIALAVADGCQIATTSTGESPEVQGVNDKKQLAALERYYQMRKAEELLNAGVTLADPARLDIRGDVHCGKDVSLDVNVILEGAVSIGDNSCIGPNVVIRNSRIGDNVIVLANCHIEGAIIGNGCTVGPFARIREGTVLEASAKIGNFVETKKAVIGKASKVNHLSYIGDAEIGDDVNIGAGTITCNYDGANKHVTVIGKGSFIGSNSVLVAPVTIEEHGFVAAGSAINTNVPKGSLAVARSKQRNISGWQRPHKDKVKTKTES
ncbi:MAG: bifunctional UDP-N-acetylglucosamine diphosphorylase/glucosamine-1-phosphate N-acetyltransferase GlmU [Pseudohongiellaceae bacterium]